MRRPPPSPRKWKKRKLEDKCTHKIHTKGCRPGRPLCRWMRKKQKAKYGVCECGAVPWPHRRGYCISGAAYRFMVRDMFKLRGIDFEDEAVADVGAFFDGLAAEAQAS